MQEVKKKIVLRVSVVFVILILLLTFFSKTMATITLTNVRVTRPIKGRLVKEIEAEGKVDFKQKYKIYASSAGDLIEDYVNTGDYINKGQKLCLIDTTAQQRDNEYHLELLKLQIAENNITISGLKAQLSSLGNEIKDLNSTIKDEAFTEIQDSKVDEVELAMLKKQVDTNQALYNEGLLSQEELKLSEKAVLELEEEIAQKALDREKEQKEKNKQINEQKKQVEAEYKEVQKSLALAEINHEKLVLEQKKLLEEKVRDGIILAKDSGMVVEKKVSAGEKVTENQELMSIGINSKGYCVNVEVSKESDFIAEGNAVVLKINNLDIEGHIQKINSSGEKKIVEVVFFNDQIKAGEVAKLNFKKESEVYNMLIPYEALYKEENKYYVYVAKRMDDTLGESYVVKKKYVYIEDYDESYAAISEGISSGDCIIQISENEISEGQKVRVENENEILE